MNTGTPLFSRYGQRTRRSSAITKARRSLFVGAALVIGTLLGGQIARADDIYVGDTGDNTVKRFDAATGVSRGTFVQPGTAGLNGPMGMIFTDGQLIVVNQDFGSVAGDVLRFDSNTGMFLGKLVSSTDRGAGFAPQGVVRGDPGDRFYVADLGLRGDDCANEGNVNEYNDAGAFLGNLDRRGFKPAFYPRGVVFGPDGLLYVAARGCPLSTDPADALIAYVLRFDPHSRKFIDVFASSNTVPDFHRPEGLVFDDHGDLWITSFRDNSNANDVDRILKLDGRTGQLRDSLPLWETGAPRAFAQAILFGPDGKLFIPIAGNAAETTGQLRRCDTETKHCDVIVAANSAGGPLVSPWFLIFKRSDPATLTYRGR
ncbi:NHL repeat-containing protein [Paraburkholderia diazotrophica]|uniref:Sugar lactone lactonase YvrE n=1 Tax=Paraburkholderia diazotrophica TaxID=667676 RepID=A0A1H6SPW8_9BURK|nr:hypothetical protein [Paraburkholderia diazotrophica]SEI66090.1 hypothetical protein SAMN05192539_1003187 [Paraburkholderia diazotrophica]